MFDLDQAVQWLAYLFSCLSNDIASAECDARWSNLALIGFVVGSLIIALAAYIYYRINRNYQRDRARSRIRDVAAIEELADAQTGESSMRILARKYRDLIEKSGLKGWRIFGDK